MSADVELSDRQSMPLRASRRVANVVKIHLANPFATLALPWLIFVAVFALNYAIWVAVSAAAGGRDALSDTAFANNGAATWIYVFLLIAAIQAMSLTFRFALGLGVTRRDYFVGTALFLLGLAVFYAAGATVLSAVELATDGWGIGGHIFAPFFLSDLPLVQQFAVHVLVALVFFGTGQLTGSLWVRWRAMGLYAFFTAVVLATAGLIVTASVLDGWSAIGAFFTDRSPLAVLVWTVPVSALLTITAFAILRRATSR